MAVTDQLSLGRSLVLLICLLGLFHSTTATYKCYECSTTEANDSCAVNPTSAKQVDCGAVSSCSIKRISDSSTHKLTSIDRSCSITVPLFGGKSKCQTTGGVKTCTVYCSKNLCNDVVDSGVGQLCGNEL